MLSPIGLLAFLRKEGAPFTMNKRTPGYCVKVDDITLLEKIQKFVPSANIRRIYFNGVQKEIIYIRTQIGPSKIYANN